MTSHSNPVEISIVIPVYNSVAELSMLVKKIEEVLTEHVNSKYEIILIDDASPNPDTWKNIESLCVRFPKVKAIRLMRNFGQQAATLCGLHESTGQIMITMDDDLQHDPADIPKLLAESSHDIVIAHFNNKKHTLFKRFTSVMKGWFDTIILGKPRGLQLSSFRVLKKNVVLGMLSIKTPYPFIPALMFYVTKDIVGVRVEHHIRNIGYSGYSLLTLIQLFSNLIVNNSSLLLRIIGILGCTCSFFSLLTGLYFIWRKIFSDISIAGWTSVIVATLFLGGATLLSIGIIGEYLIRIIRGVEKKPAYVVRDICGFVDKQSFSVTNEIIPVQ